MRYGSIQLLRDVFGKGRRLSKPYGSSGATKDAVRSELVRIHGRSSSLPVSDEGVRGVPVALKF